MVIIKGVAYFRFSPMRNNIMWNRKALVLWHATVIPPPSKLLNACRDGPCADPIHGQQQAISGMSDVTIFVCI